MAQFPSKLTIAFSWGLLPLFIISLLSQMSEFEDAFTLDFPVMSGVYWKQPHTFEVERHGLVHSILYRSYIVEIHRRTLWQDQHHSLEEAYHVFLFKGGREMLDHYLIKF
ncbi:hypothetical protein P3L10_020674 [Capsicum annuum]